MHNCTESKAKNAIYTLDMDDPLFNLPIANLFEAHVSTLAHPMEAAYRHGPLHASKSQTTFGMIALLN